MVIDLITGFKSPLAQFTYPKLEVHGDLLIDISRSGISTAGVRNVVPTNTEYLHLPYDLAIPDQFPLMLGDLSRLTAGNSIGLVALFAGGGFGSNHFPNLDSKLLEKSFWLNGASKIEIMQTLAGALCDATRFINISSAFVQSGSGEHAAESISMLRNFYYKVGKNIFDQIFPALFEHIINNGGYAYNIAPGPYRVSGKFWDRLSLENPKEFETIMDSMIGKSLIEVEQLGEIIVHLLNSPTTMYGVDAIRLPGLFSIRHSNEN